jgi:abhydrolase domain-containing protein 14
LAEEFIEVDDLRIRYWSNDVAKAKDLSKPTVVLFHGNAFSLDNWKETKTLDALTSADFPVYAIDLPVGKGSKSDKVDESKFRAYKDILPIIESIFSKLGIGFRDLVIVGPSLGGGLAVSYALAHQKRIVALVLIAPALHRLDQKEQDEVSNLDMPILLIWGDKDTVIPLEEFGRPLKNQLSHSKLLILKDTGHSAYLEKPSEFNEILTDFLSEIS